MRKSKNRNETLISFDRLRFAMKRFISSKHHFRLTNEFSTGHTAHGKRSHQPDNLLSIFCNLPSWDLGGVEICLELGMASTGKSVVDNDDAEFVEQECKCKQTLEIGWNSIQMAKRAKVNKNGQLRRTKR